MIDVIDVIDVIVVIDVIDVIDVISLNNILSKIIDKSIKMNGNVERALGKT